MQPATVRPIPELQTENLVLRPLRQTDAHEVFAYAQDPEVARHTLWEPHRTLDDSRAFIDFAVDQHRNGIGFIWAIVYKRDLRVIGSIGLANYSSRNSRAELGFAIARAYWNRGITTEAVRVVLGYAFRKLELNRVEAFCKVANGASARVMEKSAMKFEGVLRQREFIKGQYEDVKMYAILKNDFLT